MSKKDLLKRLRRAQEDRARYQITVLGQGSWRVRKFRNARSIEATYYVNTRTLICSCPDFKEVLPKLQEKEVMSVCKHLIMCVFQGCSIIAEQEKRKALVQAHQGANAEISWATC